jgi:hypothetical protein
VKPVHADMLDEPDLVEGLREEVGGWVADAYRRKAARSRTSPATDTRPPESLHSAHPRSDPSRALLANIQAGLDDGWSLCEMCKGTKRIGTEGVERCCPCSASTAEPEWECEDAVFGYEHDPQCPLSDRPPATAAPAWIAGHAREQQGPDFIASAEADREHRARDLRWRTIAAFCLVLVTVVSMAAMVAPGQAQALTLCALAGALMVIANFGTKDGER